MVSIAVLGKMNKYLTDNMERYRREHLGEIVLLEQEERGEIHESFHKTSAKLNLATKKYRKLIGPTILTHTILPEDSNEIYGLKGLLKRIAH